MADEEDFTEASCTVPEGRNPRLHPIPDPEEVEDDSASDDSASG